MALRNANRRGWLAIGFRAGAPRLEGRRRDQEREPRGGRGRFGSGRHRCLPEVSGRAAAPSRFLGTVCEAPPSQRGRAAGGRRRIMSAKDERARDILRGFKLYPPGSRGGAGRAGEEAVAPGSRAAAGAPGGHRGHLACERGQERNGVPGPPGGTANGRRAQGRPEGGRGR